MNKLTIKMQGNYYIALIDFFNRFNEDQIYTSVLSKLVYKELKELIVKTSLRASLNEYKGQKKMISLQLPKSYAMLFFCSFNGVSNYSEEGVTLSSVAINEMCRQIEQILFIKENLTFEQL